MASTGLGRQIPSMKLKAKIVIVKLNGQYGAAYITNNQKHFTQSSLTPSALSPWRPKVTQEEFY